MGLLEPTSLGCFGANLGFLELTNLKLCGLLELLDPI